MDIRRGVLNPRKGSLALLGEQVGDDEKALRNITPSLASCCRWGVEMACPKGSTYLPVLWECRNRMFGSSLVVFMERT